MHPDANYEHPRSLDEAESGTFDPYLASAAAASAETKAEDQENLSESMRVVLDELSATATSRRADLLNSKDS